MRGRVLEVAITLVVMAGTACDGPTDVDDPDEIVGTWISAGDDLAPGLTVGPFGTDSILTTFSDDGSYEAIQWAAGAEIDRVGTWEAGPGEPGQIRTVTLVQTAPSELTFQGIFEVSGESMRYEVIQVDPSLDGVDPPTVFRGFGSTRVNSIPTGPYWIQHYDRRD